MIRWIRDWLWVSQRCDYWVRREMMRDLRRIRALEEAPPLYYLRLRRG